jgi:hypothetical protein
LGWLSHHDQEAFDLGIELMKIVEPHGPAVYLECGSIGALAQELARRDIVSKVRTSPAAEPGEGGDMALALTPIFSRIGSTSATWLRKPPTAIVATVIDRFSRQYPRMQE